MSRKLRRAWLMLFITVNRVSFAEWYNVRNSYWARIDYYRERQLQRTIKTMKGE